jgi:hypothetical protein
MTNHYVLWLHFFFASPVSQQSHDCRLPNGKNMSIVNEKICFN